MRRWQCHAAAPHRPTERTPVPQTQNSVPVGSSELSVFPLGLGTNTFDDTADPGQFFTILDEASASFR